MTPALLIATLGLAAPGPKDAKKDSSPLVGDWVYEKIVTAGGDGPVPPKGLTMTFAPDGTVAVHSGNEIPRGTPYKVDPKKDPPEIDYIAPAGTGTSGTFGIYRIDGDTLTLCLPYGNNALRPTAFESPVGTEIAIITLKRVKAKD
jgi:uncharacterized protein (TIGR03067 family)